MPHSSLSPGTKLGTLGGTLLTIFGNIQSEDILRTAILAAIGATVSFAGAAPRYRWYAKQCGRGLSPDRGPEWLKPVIKYSTVINYQILLI